MKLFYYDLETTGVKSWKNGIHQISGCIEIDGKVEEYFDFKVQPHPLCTIEDDALAVANVTREQVMAYPPMNEVFVQLITLLHKYVDRFNKKDKFFLVGYNNRHFDDNFFRAFFEQNKDQYFGSWFWADSHDVMVLASYYLRKERTKLLDFKLMTVAKHLGIKVDETKLHDATYDIDLTRQIYHIIDLM